MGIGRINAYFLKLKHRFGFFWPLLVGTVAFTIVVIFGLFIYMGVEGWGFWDSFYQIVITLSTVGFQEARPLSTQGRILTAVLILMGVGGFFYLMGSFSQMLIEGRLQVLLGRRRVQKLISSLEDHFIVCGYGRIGSVVVREIQRSGYSVVIIENNPDVIKELEREQFLYIHGDATSDQHLLAAGLKKAKALIAALNQESENVYVTLTARQINPTMQIVARAEKEQSIEKLQFAGADRVLTPHIIGGLRMAQLVLRPTVTDFLDLAMRGSNIELQMEELLITQDSMLADKNLIESEIRPKYNLIIIAIKRPSGEMIFNPQPTTVIHPRDTIIVVGKKESFEGLQEAL